MDTFGLRPPPLTLILGFHLTVLICDPMHALHLGVFQWIVASVMVLLAEAGEWGVYRGERIVRLNNALRRAYRHFKEWCRQHGINTSQECFTAASTGRAEDAHSFPQFKGKAANTGRVIEWLHAVYDAKGQRCLITCLLWGCCEMIAVMRDHKGPFLSADAARRFAHGGHSALVVSKMT